MDGVVEYPRIDGQLASETNEKENDDHMVVQCPARSSMEKKMMQNNERANDRRNEKSETKPKLDR